MIRPNSTIKDLPWPLCVNCCSLIEELGTGECEAICPDKFKDKGGIDNG